MTTVVLEPNRSACVQTMARREYDRLLRAVLHHEEPEGDLDERFTVIQRFLESTDFSELRGRYEPHLAAGRRVTFTLRLAGDGIDVRMIIGEQVAGGDLSR